MSRDVLSGVADAAAELDGAEPLDTANALTTLWGRVLALTARADVDDEASAGGKKKAKAERPA